MKLEIKNVSMHYGEHQVLKNVSFQLGKGLHYIVGPSGSGKSTLLKIICGLESGYEGDVFYEETRLKDITSKEKSYFYNQVFGFVWQNNNLLEHKTVLENVCLPTYVKDNAKDVSIDKILKDLEIYRFANQKVNCLSGGQKQRVAFARELMKNPDIIIADEPTSALDEKSAAIMMDMLRKLAKHKIVLIVTHDTSLIAPHEHVMKIEKGCFYTEDQNIAKTSKPQKKRMPSLSISHAIKLALENIHCSIGRSMLSIATCILASLLLLTTCSGIIGDTSKNEFDKLFELYGEPLLDLNLTSSFMNASGTDNQKDEKPNGDVNQDISNLYEKYVQDERVKFALYTPAFNDIEIIAKDKKLKVESSGNVPVINTLLSGRYPDNTKKEVVVPESFVKKMGVDKESVLGTSINFTGSMVNWDSGEPVYKDVQGDVEIVGVIDTTAAYEYEGKKMEYSVDDSFIFAKSVLDDFKAQANMKEKSLNFTMRANSPEDLISLKDELNKQGIVPIGQFELVEDYLKLGSQSNTQSSFASVIIATIAIVSASLVAMMIALLRKREFAIYKLSGFHKSHISKLILMETIEESVLAIVVMLVSSPLLNMMMKSIFSLPFLQLNYLIITACFLLLFEGFTCFITILLSRNANINITLKTGDNS